MRSKANVRFLGDPRLALAPLVLALSAACSSAPSAAGTTSSGGTGGSGAAAGGSTSSGGSGGSGGSGATGGAQTGGTGGAEQNGLSELNHIVVIVLENWSFDSLYGEFAGAEGLSSPSAKIPQIDPKTGAAYPTLPQEEPSIPANLPNAPFALDDYLPANQKTKADLVTKFYQEQRQIDGGKMDLFVAVNSSSLGLTMGYYHTAGLPLAKEAQKYALCDHFHHAAFGGSFLNHMWLVAAATPTFPNAPASMKAVLGADGYPTVDPQTMKLLDGPVTPDGYVVGTAYPKATPHPANVPDEQLVPPQTMPTIGDRLSEKNVDWAWYSGGWNDAVAGKSDPAELFQFHHQPFVYFANYADGTPGRAVHLKDETDFVAAAKAGTLPAVAFVKPAGVDNEHPQYTDLTTGEEHVIQLIDAVRNGPNWADTAIIVTYDENGGFWDHVAPPKGDEWGPGTRVPTIVISPYAAMGKVDHTVYDTTSITATIEHRWDLAPLGARDAAAADLSGAFDFSRGK